ncbi:hydrogenase maturation protease [Lignipirellula cremea]|uniref:Hydrogenase maturation protease n=1 Tax=Lignipirellula cremea TaxID=2528010 RepID=A0A518E448_9BACT|nr:hydrogenase maturation protease [Lignipirellula cremea]QDU98870.1 Hydrogenase maturation protease [Lignipirellula cremea]
MHPTDPGAAAVRIVGVGSPHGDDRIGWIVVNQLQANPPSACDLAIVSNPMQIFEHRPSPARMILIDACRSGARPGSITRLCWPDTRIAARHSASSHGLGVWEAILLAQQLGDLQGELVLFGMEILQADPLAEVSAALMQRLPTLCNNVRAEAERMAAAGIAR